MTETKLTGALPAMNVEISHHAEPDGSAEHMTIRITATPDFRAALPLAGGLMQLPGMLAPMGGFQAPLAAWQAMMAPWARMMRANPFLPAPIAQLLDRDNN